MSDRPRRNPYGDKQKPWEAEAAPAEIYTPAGMLGDEERRALFWIAKNAYLGRGAIVDAGAFIGASAFCLAAGAAQSGKAPTDRPVVYSFDYFSAIDNYVVDFISREIRPIADGESYLDVFEGQTRRYRSLIEARSGDFLNQGWGSQPIEVLFIDIAKTQDLNSHVVKEFFPNLVVGQSTVIQQDFYHLWHPYIHITMEYLSEYFELVDEYVSHQSRVYLYSKKIPAKALRRVVDYDFSVDERRDLLRRAADRSHSPVREMLEAIVVYQCALDHDAVAFEQELSAFEKRHPDLETNPNLWADQLKQAIIDRKSMFP